MELFYQKELEKIKKIIKKKKGTTVKEISEKIGINRNAVAKYLDVLQTAGEVKVKKFGRSKVYFPSHSAPISTFPLTFMFDFSYELIVVVSNDMNIIEINTPLVKYLNLLKKEKIMGKPIKNLPIAKSCPKMTDDILKVLKNQEILEDKIEYKRKNSSTSDRFLVKFVPTTFDDGETGVTVIMSNGNLVKTL